MSRNTIEMICCAWQENVEKNYLFTLRIGDLPKCPKCGRLVIRQEPITIREERELTVGPPSGR
ncbi:MAG: hypothetical protein N2482_03380 [Patescibacteria group bacterium]|nr:hypothetical protein [Patescibacteria group bacterium]